MKNLILIAFLLITVGSTAQAHKPIYSFLGINFESTPGEVIRGLKAKGAVEDIAYNNNYKQFNTLRFTNVSIGNRQCVDFYVMFINDQAYQAEFTFEPDEPVSASEYYSALSRDVSDAYGRGYVNNDKTYWRDSDRNSIVCLVSSNRVKLVYREYKLLRLAISLRKAVNQSEF